MSSLVAGRHQAFQQRLNTLTGESEWIVINEKDDDDVDETALSASRSFLSVTSYLDMLNDSRRNVAFRLAIEKTITDPCHVLDIGAGTGLLSMMAARAMMESAARGEAKVSACESYLPMGKLMRKILRANGMESMVKLFHKRSDELQVGVDLDCRASVLVSEILDSELLGEGLIPTLQHAHDMLLTSNAKTIPYHATTYGQLVESTFLWKLNDLHGNDVSASDGICLSPAGLVHVKSQQYAIHFNSLCNEMRLLSEPFKIFEFDFWKRPDSHGETEIWINPTDDGKVHAVVTWWVLQLDREGSVLYSTAPSWIGSSKNEGVDCWRDHWKQCVWFIPGEGISVSRDTNILFKAVHDVTNISYFLGGDKNMTYSSFNSHDSHLCLSPERIGIYGEKDIRSAFQIAVKNALQRIRVPPLCVVADDSIILTILAGSLSDTSKIISSFHGFQGKGCAYIQALSVANGFSMDRVQVLNKRIASLLLDGTPWKVDLFLAEPFYHGNEGMLPWQNLKFWRDRSLLDPILSKDAIVLPCKGILKVCAMYLPDLWKSRCCLQEIEGFDHSIANETLGAYGNWPPSIKGTCLPFFIWQCGEIKELSDVFSIMDFNFSKPVHDCYGNIRIEFSEPGICHGLVLWIDWVLDVDNSITISTGPVNRYWKQGVKLLSTPLKVDVGSSVEIEASFDAASGELTLESLFPP
ncbi:protein arginine N-methyltransferase 7 [Dendrobium catenatum]|uniref:Protein arginine N-methyltransferase 7 n=1 Tax=Dendrobium catenatum TaxID=906689 RepID=A0A2I0WXU2_9ASPA|nr:protein arginine N-methyltransferase 7 [Dendrobium catenatum]XP_020674058.1 protein arginine N-methyltransferase 7 [Dendrobium catenatum]PKU80479.1 Protein arginine N-methyltransferase 7 [Dendrobium catenatum]